MIKLNLIFSTSYAMVVILFFGVIGHAPIGKVALGAAVIFIITFLDGLADSYERSHKRLPPNQEPNH